MQGLHHQQQQLAALLSVALPKDDSSSPSKPDDDDSARLAALNSLHRAILYPPNSLLVTHSASFLAQGFSQLLSDKCYGVRQEAAVAYGALCAVVCSIPITSNGRQNHVMLGSLVDRFIGWALPLLSLVVPFIGCPVHWLGCCSLYLLQTEESLGSLGSDGVQFVIAHIIECYTSVCDWKSLEIWLLELQTLRAKHAGKSYCGALTTTGNEINAIHALAQYDEGEYQAAWACLGLTPKSSSDLALDPKLALQRSEQMLLQAMLFQNGEKEDKVPHELEKARSMLEETLSVLPQL